MIHIFNRKQVLADFDISLVAQARDLLNQNGIPQLCRMKRGDDRVAHATGNTLPVGGRNRRDNSPRTFVHLLYVQKKDYQRAKEILHEAKLI